MTDPETHRAKKLKKWLYVASAFTILGLIALLSYKKIIAYTVSNALIKDSAPSFMLGPYQKKIYELKAPVNKASEQLIYKLDSLHIPFDVFLLAIDNLDKKEIIQTFKELKVRKPETPNAVFNIVKQTIRVKEFDTEIFRKPFLKYATMDKINKALQYIEMHNLAAELDISISREIIKKVLIQKKDEIASRLKTSGGISTY